MVSDLVNLDHVNLTRKTCSDNCKRLLLNSNRRIKNIDYFKTPTGIKQRENNNRRYQNDKNNDAFFETLAIASAVSTMIDEQLGGTV